MDNKALSWLKRKLFGETHEEYFKRNPEAKLYVDSNGRSYSNVGLLIRRHLSRRHLLKFVPIAVTSSLLIGEPKDLDPANIFAAKYNTWALLRRNNTKDILDAKERKAWHESDKAYNDLKKHENY